MSSSVDRTAEPETSAVGDNSALDGDRQLDAHLQSGVDVVVPTHWLGGAALFAAAIAYVVVSLAERFVYDVRVFGPAWIFPMLFAGGAGWLTMMFVGAQRLRVDDAGVHVRTLFRERDVPWSDVQLLGVRPPRIPLVDGIVTVVAGYRSVVVPTALHAHDVGAHGILERVAALAEANGISVDGVPPSDADADADDMEP